MNPRAPGRPASRGERGGFTLIELLVVIAIIGVLAALLFAAMQRVNQNARTAQCLAALRSWALAFPLYAADNDGLLPTHDLAVNYYVWELRIAPYVTGEPYGSSDYIALCTKYHCPGDTDFAKPNNYPWAYATNMNLLTSRVIRRFSDFPAPAETLLLEEGKDCGLWSLAPGANPNTGMQYTHHGNGTANFAFADLHCQSMTYAQAQQQARLVP